MAKNKQIGSALPIVLAAIALVGLVGYNIYQWINLSVSLQGNIATFKFAEEVTKKIVLATENAKDCNNTFAPMGTFNTADIPLLAGQTYKFLYTGGFQIPGGEFIPLNTPIPSTQGTIKISKIEMTMYEPLSTGGADHITDMNLTFERVTQNILTSGGFSVQKIPLRLSLAPKGPTTAEVVQCFATGQTNTKDSCNNLGGLWVDATNNASNSVMQTRCPKTNLARPRCIFGNSYELNGDELPDEVPCDGWISMQAPNASAPSGFTHTGERATECHYQRPKENLIRTASCRAFETGKGNRCIFSDTTQRWELRRQTVKSGLVLSKNDILKQKCTHGVTITHDPESLTTLHWNDRLFLANPDGITDPIVYDPNYDAPNEFSWKEQLEWLGSVDRCIYSAVDDVYLSCKNTNDLNIALTGQAGSCIYVKNTFLAGGSTTKKRILQCQEDAVANGNAISDCPSPDISVVPYTGWIYVNNSANGRVFKTTKASRTANTILTKEATGIPCFSVELSTHLRDSETINTLVPTNVPVPDLALDPSLIQYCLVHTKDTKDITVDRKSMIACSNEDFSATNNVADAFLDGIQPEEFFGKNNCWLLAPPFTNSASVVSYSRILGAKYSGWANFTSNNLPAKFSFKSGDYQIRSSSGTAHVPANPCADGILRTK